MFICPWPLSNYASRLRINSGGGGLVFFVWKVPDYKSAILIHFFQFFKNNFSKLFPIFPKRFSNFPIMIPGLRIMFLIDFLLIFRRYVWLEDCHHTIESITMEKYLESVAMKVMIPDCPLCRAPINSTLRFMNQVKLAYHRIAKLKVQIYGMDDSMLRMRKMVKENLQEFYDFDAVGNFRISNILWTLIGGGGGTSESGEEVLENLEKNFGMIWWKFRENWENIIICLIYTPKGRGVWYWSKELPWPADSCSTNCCHIPGLRGSWYPLQSSEHPVERLQPQTVHSRRWHTSLIS